jgi:peptidoglycan/xylan/chitin deacetylase (PgdA/CDA1 family)
MHIRKPTILASLSLALSASMLSVEAQAQEPLPPSSTPAHPAKVLFRGGTSDTQPKVALTFDDGGAQTLPILRVLQEKGVIGTFFPQTSDIDLRLSDWQEVEASGYPIGNHSYNHPTPFQHLSYREGFVEFDSARRRNMELLPAGNHVDFLRVPGGVWWQTNTLQASADAGYPWNIVWDVSAQDSGNRPTEANVYENAIKGGDGSIVLFHLRAEATTAALPRIIDNYQSRGFRIVTLDEMVQDLPVTTVSATIKSSTSAQTSAIPYKISWNGTDPNGDSIALYNVQQQTGDASSDLWNSWSTIYSGTALKSVTRYLKPNGKHSFRVRSKDSKGDWGSWSFLPSFVTRVRDDTSIKGDLVLAGSWKSSSDSAFYKGSVLSSTAAGNSVNFTSAGGRVAWMSTRGPDRGSAKVYIGDKVVATINLYSPSVRYRQIVFARKWKLQAGRSLRIVSLDSQRVDIDALVYTESTYSSQ